MTGAARARWPVVGLAGAFAGAVVILAALGAVLLTQPGCTAEQARQMEHYAWRHYWQCAFDSVSAVTGVGVLTYDFDHDYTPRGRWTLTVLGLLGASLQVAALAMLASRLHPAGDVCRTRRWLLAGFLAWAIAGAILGLIYNSERGALDCLSASAGLGWPSSGAIPRGVLAGLAMIAALVPAIVAALMLRAMPSNPLLGRYSWSYPIGLAGLIVLLWVVETPGQGGLTPTGGREAAAAPVVDRWGLATLAVLESAAGMPVDAPAFADVTDPGRAVVALAILAGSPALHSGGLRWVVLIAALGAALGRPRLAQRRWRRAAVRCAVTMAVLAGIVALGLVGLERFSATAYQPPVPWGTAVLEACSIVAGANSSATLIEAVTGRHLTSGMGLAFNAYQLGMAWIMLGMLVGKVAPIALLSWTLPLRPGPKAFQ